MSDQPTQRSLDLRKWGSKGGFKRAENLTAEQLSAIGRKGHFARFGPPKPKRIRGPVGRPRKVVQEEAAA